VNDPARELVAPGLPARIALPAATSIDRITEQRAIGALVGSAVGDALGARFEFGPAGAYRREFPEPVLGGIGEMVGGGPFPWKPGEFTDDTQMAVALAESLLACGGFDADDVWRRWRSWAKSATDVGVLTRRVLSAPDWRGAAEAGHHASGGLSAANGALMRVTGLTVAYAFGDPAELTLAAQAQAALTHHDPAAGWGAAIGAQLVRAAIEGMYPLSVLDDLVAELPADVHDRFAEVLDPAWDPTVPGAISSGTVWGCLGRAVWALRRSGSFAEAVVEAIDLGGDTDTVAAVTGAIAGAWHSVQGIPCRWTTYLNGTVDGPGGTVAYDNDGVRSLARRLMGRSAGPATPPETPAGPVRVAPRLHAADLGGAIEVPKDWAVVSMCRTDGAFAEHPVRREVYLIDQPAPSNAALGDAVADAVDTIDALLNEGHDVVVHCHGGRSRTGLVLKAWAMRNQGIDERQAHEWLASKWYRYDDYEPSFVELLQNLGSEVHGRV
jgi:ADP-ribosyl-[dinitrogen reductase] hydrolase